MISIIICSRNKAMLAQTTESISRTIGVDHEFIPIDNSNGDYSIFEAYNLGVERASGETLCFVHEDVLFYTQNWGQIVTDKFKRYEDIGMIGVMGGQASADAPFYWPCIHRFRGENRIVHSKILFKVHEPVTVGRSSLNHWRFEYSENLPDNMTEVTGVDGMFFCIRKSLFDEGLIRFDDKTYSGFHYYDRDICHQVFQHKKIIIATDIFTEHLSAPITNRQFFESGFKCYEKWQHRLPQTIYPIPESDIDKFNQNTALIFFRNVIDSGGFTYEEIRDMARKYYYGYIKDAPRTKYFYKGVYLVKYRNKHTRKMLYLLSRAGIPLCSKL